MKQLKKEVNEIINRITEEELKQNIKNTEERIIHRKINEVINLMNEREELYEVRMVYQLQEQTKKIEELKKQLELLVKHERSKKDRNINIILELYEVIEWIEEEQEKFRL